jgi:hypothetical protein
MILAFERDWLACRGCDCWTVVGGIALAWSFQRPCVIVLTIFVVEGTHDVVYVACGHR